MHTEPAEGERIPLATWALCALCRAHCAVDHEDAGRPFAAKYDEAGIKVIYKLAHEDGRFL